MAVAWVDVPEEAVWRDPDGEKPYPKVVRLMRCTVRGCPVAHFSPVIARGEGNGEVDVAASGSGAVAAVMFHPEAERRKDDGQSSSTLRIVSCADMSCAAPRTLVTTRLALPVGGIGVIGGARDDDEQLAIATGSKGRPVVAYEDPHNGAVTVVSCDDASCRRPVVRRLVEPQRSGLDRGGHSVEARRGVELVVAPDDRPVLLYRDVRSGQVRLLRCRTPDCAGVDAVTVTGPQIDEPMRALALAHDGLPLVATFDMARRRLVLAACRTADCARRDSVVLLNDVDPGVEAPDGLHMVVSRDGRPAVLWTGIDEGDGPSRARLVSCRDVRCGA
jgi:hypothetical protein